ncbi:type II secretion system F family protein [Candidatus Gracilibacteria bacterium]|nr:type II secretion system F family protein [Candidatus Gracilibacteria bacterium]MCF7856157.1 type II secretion system F family protein [Candidatus Gracilibacteria bacterium]MCF7896623.1 type II secretion system F family protein [Candidatus Gracilibacteria bacterium]
MQFDYTARDKNGKEITGTISATSKLEAADKLFNEKRLNVVSLEQADTKKDPEKKPNTAPSTKSNSKITKNSGHSAQGFMNSINEFLATHAKVLPKDKAIVFLLLAVMINAGLSIVKALKILSKQSENPKLKMVLEDIAKKVEGGVRFSDGLKEYSEIFLESEIGMIEAGEASGQLNKTLVNLATETEKSSGLSKKIKSAMIYPAVVVTILIGAVFLVMTMVIPKLGELFSGAGAELPFATQLLVNTSNWFIGDTLIMPNWLWLICIMVGGVILINWWKKTPTGKVSWDRFLLNLPIFGMLNKKAALASFSRQLALLSDSGVAIVCSLEITANAVGNEVYRLRLLEVKADVERGIAIHKSIEGDKLFPDLVVSMIAVGEQTAQLGAVTQKIAVFYDEEVDTYVKNLSTIMEPVIIVVIGVMVGGLVAAIMQPIMELTDVAALA